MLNRTIPQDFGMIPAFRYDPMIHDIGCDTIKQKAL